MKKITSTLVIAGTLQAQYHTLTLKNTAPFEVTANVTYCTPAKTVRTEEERLAPGASASLHFSSDCFQKTKITIPRTEAPQPVTQTRSIPLYDLGEDSTINIESNNKTHTVQTELAGAPAAG